MMRRFGTRLQATLAGLLFVAGCAVAPATGPIAPVQPPPATTPAPPTPNTAAGAARSFISVMRLMEPAVERECVTRRTSPINCDFQFVVDDRPGLEPNAFQTVDAAGRPVIGFTLSLIAATRNADEIAFVVGHEASHHILGHLGRKTASAQAGAVILGSILTASGAPVGTIRTAQGIGAELGARSYSKQWELEADYLGAIITRMAGFDPMNGAQFFLRIPDPGDHILGSHPSRAQRLAQVSRAMADLQSGRAR